MSPHTIRISTLTFTSLQTSTQGMDIKFSLCDYMVHHAHFDTFVPTIKTARSIGMDIKASKNIVIQGGQTTKIPTGIKIVENNLVGVFLKLESRSSVAKAGVFVQGGIIDNDYIDHEIFVLLFNSSKNNYVVSKGDRIAQLIPYHFDYIQQPDQVPRTGGFGSTNSC